MITLFCARSAAIHNSVHYSFIVSPALPLRSCRQQKQGEEFIVSHLLLVPSRVIRHWTCIYACVMVVIDLLKLLLKDSYFFQKNTRTADLDRHSFLSVFLPYFTFLNSGISQKIGHTGIANAKKWLDQAVFPCWSNYHTLAGE